MRRFAIYILLLIPAVSAKAQFDTATVLGTVTDPSGAVVAHSNVVLHNTATAVEQTAVTDDRGEFRFVDISIGSYELKVTAKSFQPATAKFELTVGARQRVDVGLKVATANSTVTAMAEAAQLETDSSEHSQVVAAREIAALPLNGREYSQLVELSTGVVPSPSNLSDTYDTREGAFIVNGLRSVFTNYLLDGVDNNFYGTSNQGFSNEVVQLSPDSVAEFRVVTNNESAEYGRAGGATINVVTKYGTNQIHGDVWEFLRNTNLDAEGYFLPDVGGKPSLHRNQFGGTFGGPIKKDKLFFFVDYEGYRQTGSFTDEAELPSCAERGMTGTTTCSGSLGYYLIDDQDATNPTHILPVGNPCPLGGGVKPGGGTGVNPCSSPTDVEYGLGGYYGGKIYTNGAIPSSAVIPFASELLSYLPSPTNTSEYYNYIILHPQTWDQDKGDAKVDWTPRENLHLFVRYSQSRYNVIDPGNIPGVAGDNGDGQVYAPIKDVVGGATWTISPVSVLEARFGFSSMQAGKKPIQAGGPSMAALFGTAGAGLPTDPQYTGGVSYQYFIDGGFTSLGRLWTSPQYQNPTMWDPKVNYTRLVGSHSLKAGIEYNMLHVAQQDLHPVMGGSVYTESSDAAGAVFDSGTVGPSTCTPPYCGPYGPTATTQENERMFDYADFLLGYQAELGLASPTVSQLRSWGWAGYVQDDWKANRRLTVNMGLRYEFDTPIYEANNQLANFNPAGPGSIVVASSGNRYTINPNTRDFGPRIGLSFAADEKTVLRGGYGISYSHWNRVGSNYLSMNPPTGIVALQLAVPGQPGYSNVQNGFTSVNVTPSGYNPLADTLQYMPSSSPDTQVRSWFFGVQRDLTHNWLVDLSYVGNYGLNEILVNDINQASVGSSVTNYARLGLPPVVPYPGYNVVAGILPWAYSDYEGLQVKVEKRFSQGLYLLNSFTWSKDIDIAAQALDGGGNCDNCGNGIPSVQNIYDWQADRGISAYNHPFVNTTSVVYSLPMGKGQLLLPNASRVLDEIVGGWQATGIVSGRSGDALNFAYSPNLSQQVSPLTSVDGRNAYRPNLIGPAVAAHRTIDPDGFPQYLNVGSFQSPGLAPPSGSTTYICPAPAGAPQDCNFGDMPRNSVRGYDYWDVDMGLSKDFALTERARLQLRAEAFNLFNHTNFSDPNTSLPNLGNTVTLNSTTAGTFGEIDSTLPARTLQVAGKIIF
jgi:hypothetical protein